MTPLIWHSAPKRALEFVLGTAALAFATAAWANPPRKPWCPYVSYSMIASAFGFRPTSWTLGGGADFTLVCDYNARSRGPNGRPHKTLIEIEFDEGSGRSGFEEYLKGYKKIEPPVQLVRGIADAAFIARSGQTLVFLDGTWVVIITNSSKSPGSFGPTDAAAIEVFAKKIIRVI